MNTNRKSFIASLASLFVLPRFLRAGTTDEHLTVGSVAINSDTLCTADVCFERRHEFLNFVFKHTTDTVQNATRNYPDHRVLSVSWHKEPEQCDPDGWTGHIRVILVPSRKLSAWLSAVKSWRS